jgi:hypothetical protein
MAYVIAEPCIGTKDTACVDVCPVDCDFRSGRPAGEVDVVYAGERPVLQEVARFFDTTFCQAA